MQVLILAFTIFFAHLSGQAYAQGIAGMEPRILDLTRGSWAYFRNYNGQQLVYFTHLEAYRCGISKVKYSLNSDALDKEWVLQPCDSKKPNEITTERPYIALPLGTAESIALQLTFTNGSKSSVVRITEENRLVK